MSFNWETFATAEPTLAKTVQERFEAFTHHILATLRKDGSPRTSGLEVRFLAGELWLGMMSDSLKAIDLRRDPRFALQANPGSGTEMGGGDVRIGGRAIEVHDPEVIAHYVGEVGPPGQFHLFRAELTEVVRTSVDGDQLAIQIWNPGKPLRTTHRQ
ncbi:pyridoxamine 5'-phosphate oxidase family protein [Streptomyces sp. E11-3]|uniref:pyridoxamine 5'-phosphate oxidase family protein n=1 Tax=Streptomyces sp. E11-3 TaxID=3110112 RepID=UPI00398153D5